MSQEPLGFVDGADLSPPDASIAAIMRSLADLTRSPDPAEVFLSLAQLCVPVICDGVTLTLRIATEPPVVSHFPAASTVSAAIVMAPIAPLTPTPLADDFSGTLELGFQAHEPLAVHAFIAQLLVERAVGVIERERLYAGLKAEQVRAGNLDLALASNREIGIAMGVLMSQRQLTSEQAFDLLRRVSQHTHRKLRAVALEIAETGAIDLPPGSKVSI